MRVWQERGVREREIEKTLKVECLLLFFQSLFFFGINDKSHTHKHETESFHD